MALVTRLLPAGAAALRSGGFFQKASVHTSSSRSLMYGFWAYILGERILPKFKTYSKIFTVEGNLSSGKGALAQKLADKLGMLYMPEADTHYMDRVNGEKEPLHQDFNGMCSLEKFYLDPKAPDGNSYRLQLWMYLMRLMQYSDALEHLLCTGQGVILERSHFSDFVFLDAMFKQGYIRKECVQHYNELKYISISEFLPPHLVIYIDVPAEEVQNRLKLSGKSYLQNVPLEYLKAIENSYKKTFLPSIEETSEVFICDSTQAQDVDRVIEEIEHLKFGKKPWVEQTAVSLHELRMLVQDKREVANMTHIPVFLPEITIGAHEFTHKYFAYRSLPGKKYATGFNEDIGDKYIWLK
ncbi:NADH dehydrogenase [ubiquinone] 1 alpha subcomplex subunit 10, mitochondrial [Austrofundulus limnaeus]|uniref:NADH dehydrogenase [ubiquinone] 1 alpha subcomplex subunit 10, mitochondrial n=1 Tax=Austrofundulus limnaeus TaxID=52670 RepID=A0A2I4D2Q7_AUSLI|nr:PREDICTED: NADH dehydrogenase [ubiquinone] 1 alpha subcomplex subunit 10, mitochondrial [Austrofundulus limnaeus]